MIDMATKLTRTIRFCLGADGSLDDRAPMDNSFAGWPPMRGLGRYYELLVTCCGTVDEVSGYMINIKQIDQAVREAALPIISRAALANDPAVDQLMVRIIGALGAALPVSVHRVELQLSPTVTVAMESERMGRVMISQRYDFSAAHRLHVSGLSDEENRELFGKCNNPSGHGHNYQLEVTIGVPVSQRAFEIGQLDALVNRVIIERYDHKHLNADTEDFALVNPSAENIAQRIYEHLAAAVKSLDAELDEVKVWETSKTACTYRGS